MSRAGVARRAGVMSRAVERRTASWRSGLVRSQLTHVGRSAGTLACARGTITTLGVRSRHAALVPCGLIPWRVWCCVRSGPGGGYMSAEPFAFTSRTIAYSTRAHTRQQVGERPHAHVRQKRTRVRPTRRLSSSTAGPMHTWTRTCWAVVRAVVRLGPPHRHPVTAAASSWARGCSTRGPAQRTWAGP